MKRLWLAAILCAMALPAVAETPDYTSVFLKDFDRSSGKLVDLAGAIPADKFGWRPVDGVRTMAEVVLHVAGANFNGAKAFGGAVPDYYGPDIEKKYTAKDDVIRVLKESQEALKKAVDGAKGDLGKEVEIFGSKRTVMSVMVSLGGHSHEHLGQLIAYARTAGITPPWSKAE